MKIVTLLDLPTYGEAGAYIQGEAHIPGSDISSCYMSSDLWMMGGMSGALPVPGLHDVWPWYIACRLAPLSNWDVCNIYRLPPEMAGWCEAVTAVSEEVSGGMGSVAHLRGLADLLESCPEFELGEPVLVDQPWPKL